MFTKILITLIILLLIYYAVMIALDLYKAKLDEESKKTAVDEVEIDITEEASGFKPTEISRDEQKSSAAEQSKQETGGNLETDEDEESVPVDEEDYAVEENNQKSLLDEDTDVLLDTLGVIPDEVRINHSNDSDDSLMEDKSSIKPDHVDSFKGLRKPISDDGIEISELLTEVEVIAQKGKSDMGDIIFMCSDEAA